MTSILDIPSRRESSAARRSISASLMLMPILHCRTGSIRYLDAARRWDQERMQRRSSEAGDCCGGVLAIERRFNHSGLHVGLTRKIDHPFAVSPEEAERLQTELAPCVVRTDHFAGDIRWIAGVDVAYREESDEVYAGVALFDVHAGRVASIHTKAVRAQFPYVPGLFSFREIPAVAAVLADQEQAPDLVICDGHGYAHTRRFGLACHLGVLFDVAAIGCGKTRLIGEHGDVGWARGARSDLMDRGEVVGSVLRTQDGVRPLYVSIGHRIGLETACEWVLRLAGEFRLPEPIRAANQAVNELRASKRRGADGS